MALQLLVVALALCSFYQLPVHCLPETQGSDGLELHRQKRETGDLLRNAVREIAIEYCHVQQLAEEAISFSTGVDLPAGMNIAQGASISLYTNKCFSNAMNDHLKIRDDPEQFRPYVDMLSDALRRLPVRHGTIWQGSSVNFSGYVIGGTVGWNHFSIATDDESAAEDFIKLTGGNVLFEIRNAQAYDISKFSRSQTELDILLPANMVFRVGSLASVSGEIYRKCVLEQLTSTSSGYNFRVDFRATRWLLMFVIITFYILF